MSLSQDRKNKFAYFAATLITLGFVATGFLEPLQSTFMLYAGGIISITGLIFGANIFQKATTKDVYLKELEIQNQQRQEEE